MSEYDYLDYILFMGVFVKGIDAFHRDELQEIMEEQPKNKYLAIDYGKKFIGLAGFDQGADPFPLCLERIQNKDLTNSLDQIVAIIEDDFYTDIIFGVPYFLDGKESDTTKELKKIALQLEKKIQGKGIQVRLHLQDESLSTYTAKERMRNSPLYNFKVDMSKIDSLSAQVILEDFLASQKKIS